MTYSLYLSPALLASSTTTPETLKLIEESAWAWIRAQEQKPHSEVPSNGR